MIIEFCWENLFVYFLYKFLEVNNNAFNFYLHFLFLAYLLIAFVIFRTVLICSSKLDYGSHG